MLRKLKSLTLVLSLLPLAAAQAADMAADMAGDVAVTQAWARASVAANGAAYVTLQSHGGADRLVGASAPVARRAELHSHINDGGVMRMRPVEAVEVPAGGSAELKPGGDHIMLMGLNAPLKEGDSFPLTLTLEKGGSVEVKVTVMGIGSMGPVQGYGSGHGHGHGQMKKE